ncbi:MAG: hypothetical protein JWO38_2237 [Gemmataceae bacterium]|nr:hypothetical protein [Gemmataceae bacterium]
MPRKLFAVLAVVLLPLSAWGQAVPSREPTSTHIFPAGGRRGTDVKVRVGGECLPPGMAFNLTGAGVTGPGVLGAEARPGYEPSVRRPPRDADGAGAATTYPREWDSAVTIAPGAEPGMKFWRVSGAWGGTRPRPFLVGDLPEFVETEPNSLPERAERIALPVVVNGQIAGERDQDFFVFAGKAGDIVVCDVMAGRIGSPLDPVVAITDTRGQPQDVQEVRRGGDPVVAFRVPATGDYRLHVANLGFGGGPTYAYRVTISTTPFPVRAFPPGGRAGETREVETYTLTGTAGFRTVTEKVTFPAVPGPFLFRGSIPLVAGELPEVAETDDNHSPMSAMELAVPVTVNARFLTADEEDWFRFAAKKGEAFTIACQPFPGDSAALPVLTLLAADGTVLVKANAVDVPDRELQLEWKAPADGAYRLRLYDLQHGSRGGHDFVYRLTVRPARPGYAMRLDPDSVNVVQGGKTEIDLHVRRTGGFTGPIDLTATGLPDGVKIEPARVPDNQTRMKLVVSAKDDTRPVDVLVTIRGAATVEGKPVECRAAVPTFGGDRDSLHLTVQHKPLFRITCNEAYQYAPRGSIHPYPVTIERLNGFTGPVTLHLCERQVQDLDGIEIVETVVPAGATQAKALIYLPETMHAGAQHHSRPYIQGHATFTDQWGTRQTILAVCDKRCMVRTTPPVAKLRSVTREIAVAPGESIECKLALDRTSNFTGAADIELVAPPGFKAPIVHLQDGQVEAVVRVRVDSRVRRQDDLVLTFRATGKLPSGGTAVTEATVPAKVGGK